MTAPLFLRRRVATRRRRVIVSVSNYWSVHPTAGVRREVFVREGRAQLSVFLPETHPALVRFLERSAA